MRNTHTHTLSSSLSLVETQTHQAFVCVTKIDKHFFFMGIYSLCVIFHKWQLATFDLQAFIYHQRHGLLCIIHTRTQNHKLSYHMPYQGLRIEVRFHTNSLNQITGINCFDHSSNISLFVPIRLALGIRYRSLMCFCWYGDASGFGVMYI